MPASLLYKLFLSTVGSMPAPYDPEVDNWWGIILTELGILDPLREENVSYFLVKLLSTLFFAFSLWGLGVCSAYKNIKKQRDDARQDSTYGAYECCDLRNKLCSANERLQASNNDIDDERKEFRNTIQNLNDQHFVDQEEIRSLKQHVSNTECDRDEYARRLGYASRISRNVTLEHQELVQKNQKLERENRQLEALVADRDGTIDDLQTRTKDLASELAAAVSSPPINIQSNDGGSAHGSDRVQDLEQQNKTLTSEIEVLRTSLDNLRHEHGQCSGHLQTQLARKDEEMSSLRAEKKAVDDESAETVTGLRAVLREKEQEVEDLEEANRELLAAQASSTETTQRLSTMSTELEVSRQAHAQCDEKSASQESRIGELMTGREQLEETLRVKNDEIGNLQGRVTDLHKSGEELQKTHVTCGDCANTQALEITDLRTAVELLQGNSGNLSQELETANIERASLIREGQLLEQQNRTLQAHVETLTQTVNHQQQRIHISGNNCLRCQKLREALDEAVKDVERSDDNKRAEMRREVAEELKSQVPNDLRKQLRGEVECQLREEFKNGYSELLARNTRRIQDQDRQIMEKDAKLEKAKNNPAVDHTACQQQEGNLQSTITKLRQDAKIAHGNYSRLNSDAKNDREQLNRAQKANEDLKRELEIIKADQQRAQRINPLQSKLAACRRESETLRVDRDKARDNCSIYSRNLSDLRKKYQALHDEHTALREKRSSGGDSLMEDGRNEEPIARQSEQRTATSTMVRDEAAALDLLRHEVDVREARDGKAKEVHAGLAAPTSASGSSAREISEGGSGQSLAQGSDDEADDKISLPINGVEKPDDELEEGEVLETKPLPKPTAKTRRSSHRIVRPPAHQPMTEPVPGGRAGKKRERGDYSDGEADDEGEDERKKVKVLGEEEIEDVMRRLNVRRPFNASAE